MCRLSSLASLAEVRRKGSAGERAARRGSEFVDGDDGDGEVREVGLLVLLPTLAETPMPPCELHMQ